MKKNTNHLVLSVIGLGFALALVAFSPLVSQEHVSREHNQKTEKEKKEALRNFSVIEEVHPVPENLKAGFESITGKDVEAYVKFLASDLLEGRDTASRGYDIASEFVAAMFSLWGIQPAGDFPVKSERFDFFSFESNKGGKKKVRSYFQEIEMREVMSRNSHIKTEYRKGAHLKSRIFNPDIDYQFRPRYTGTISGPVVFAGYGISEKEIKYDDYKNIDAKGKIVMILTGAPGKDDPQSPFNKEKFKQKYFPRRRMRHRGSPKINLAKEKGASAVLMVESSPGEKPGVARQKLASRKINDERPIIPGERRSLSLIKAPPLPWEIIPRPRISRDMADVILGYAGKKIETLQAEIEKDFKPRSCALPGVSVEIETRVEEKLVKCRNVLGYIQGSDPELKDEVVMIGGHLDHLGKRGDYIFNGADDNGSGSAAVMEIAQAFAQNPVKPKRTVMFALWTGEEKGLFGSRYYVSHPFFPLKKMVAYINLDMIGRLWTPERLKMVQKRFGIKLPEEMAKTLDVSKFFSVQLFKNQKVFDALKENNQYVGLHLFFRESAQMSGGSDHAAFAYYKVPWASFFGAMTKDYHQPSDSVEKVSLDQIKRCARLTWLAAFSLANNE